MADPKKLFILKELLPIINDVHGKKITYVLNSEYFKTMIIIYLI